MPRPFQWPAPLADMTPPQRNFTLALGVSLVVHAVVLSIQFKLPQALGKVTEQALDVILVNAKSASRPHDAQAKAQANLEGGGNVEENRRAAMPLPASKDSRDGDAVIEARQKVSALEAEQRRMMTQLKSSRAVASTEHRDPTPARTPTISGADLVSSAISMVRLEAEINRNLEEYNKRPRTARIGARTSEYRFAQYIEDWRQKVERIGNLNYPEAARGRMYGSLILSVTIKADGSIKEILVDRPSGFRVLDDAARNIVRLAGGIPFPPNIARDTDEIEITRTWTFTNADRLSAN